MLNLDGQIQSAGDDIRLPIHSISSHITDDVLQIQGYISNALSFQWNLLYNGQNRTWGKYTIYPMYGDATHVLSCKLRDRAYECLETPCQSWPSRHIRHPGIHLFS